MGLLCECVVVWLITLGNPTPLPSLCSLLSLHASLAGTIAWIIKSCHTESVSSSLRRIDDDDVLSCLQITTGEVKSTTSCYIVETRRCVIHSIRAAVYVGCVVTVSSSFLSDEGLMEARKRGKPGEEVQEADLAYLELKPFKTLVVGEIVAATDSSEAVRYAKVATVGPIGRHHD